MDKKFLAQLRAFKVLKTKHLCEVFLEWKELSMNLGQIFNKFLICKKALVSLPFSFLLMI